MDQPLASILTDLSALLLIGSLVVALFLASFGVRELTSGQWGGLLYANLAAFFLAAHLYYFVNIPGESPFALSVSDLDFWEWGAVLLAPALILIYLLRGIWDLLHSRHQAALIRVFFGLTLMAFVFMIGRTWPSDVKTILTGFYGFACLEIDRLSD